MKRLIIIFAIISFTLSAAYAQRHEKSAGKRKAISERQYHKARSSKRTERKSSLYKNRRISADITRKEKRIDFKRNQAGIRKPNKTGKYRKIKPTGFGKKFNTKAKARGYYKRTYKNQIRRPHREGHVNQFHNRRIWSRKKYHMYPVRPHFKLRWQDGWNRFYTNYFPSLRVRTLNAFMVSVPGYEASYHLHEPASVYGKVYEIFYNRDINEMYLYLGAPYPRHDFTIVITGRLADEMSRFPPRYYIGQNFTVSGIITHYKNEPEMVINYRNQLMKF